MEIKVYAARHKDKFILNSSSTGGMYTALSDFFLENGGAVVSAIYNYNSNQTELKLSTDKETRDKAKGSKYMQSKHHSIYNEALDWLENNEGSLLFIGMGCQADSFRVFSEQKGFKDRVTTVGIICHGVSSPKLWREYLGCRVDYLTFKDKRYGWKNPTAIVVKEGKEKSIDEYVRIFYNNCALRPSCHECPYTTIDRLVDITIGDYWGIDEFIPQFYSAEGNALVLLHTTKGYELWNGIRHKLEWIESNTSECLQPNLVRPTERSSHREQFWKDYKKKGIHFIIEKYGKDRKDFFLRIVWKTIKKKFNN